MLVSVSPCIPPISNRFNEWLIVVYWSSDLPLPIDIDNGASIQFNSIEPPHFASSSSSIAPTLLPQRSASNELIVMFLGCCRRGSNCIHLNAHLLCTSRPRCTRDVHSHQTISVVLMAKSATTRQLPATEEAHEGVGWLGRWFGGDVEAAGHGFDGWEGWKWGRWAKNRHTKWNKVQSGITTWNYLDKVTSFTTKKRYPQLFDQFQGILQKRKLKYLEWFKIIRQL